MSRVYAQLSTRGPAPLPLGAKYGGPVPPQAHVVHVKLGLVCHGALVGAVEQPAQLRMARRGRLGILETDMGEPFHVLERGHVNADQVHMVEKKGYQGKQELCQGCNVPGA